MTDTPVRLALVGTPDNAVVWRHAAQRLRGGLFTVAVDTKVAAAAEAVGVATAVASLEDALKTHGDEFDAAVICSSHHHNPAVARLAAEAGKHLLVEAPVAQTLAEAEAIIAACHRAGVCFAVGQTLRFYPGNQTILDRISTRKLGEPGLWRVHRWREKQSAAEPTLLERIYGDVDLAICVFGSQPTEVYALGCPSADQAASYVQLHFGFPAGGMAVLDFSGTLPPGPGYDSASLIGSTGAAYADDHHNTHLLYRGGNPAALISGQGSGHLLDELQAFVDATGEQREAPVGGNACIRAHQVIEAVVRSLETGQVLHKQGERYEPA